MFSGCLNDMIRRFGTTQTRASKMPTAIHQENTFRAIPNRIYEVFMDSKKHSEFTANGDANISSEVGGKFSCHGGRVLGRIIELVPNQRIVLAWRVITWNEGVYSIVKFEFKPEGGQTRIILDHTGIPETEHSHTETGWHTRYWGPLKAYLEKTPAEAANR
jgi:activator of HSP90 ATPase